MSNSTSVVEELLTAIPQLRPRLYFKTSLTALSHAMEDHILAGVGGALVVASFQQERFYLQEASRYLRIADLSDQIYVLSAAGTSFTSRSENYETIAFEAEDALVHEWHLVVISDNYQACLICRERPAHDDSEQSSLDQNRRFEGIWTQDPYVTQRSADILLDRIAQYRPDILNKVQSAKARYLFPAAMPSERLDGKGNPDPFTQRLVTYLQAGQYKLLKAYKAIAAQEQRERLVNSITSVIRQSLNATEIFEKAASELGQALNVCRCLIYPCAATDATATIEYEHRQPTVESLLGETWPLATSPLFDYVQDTKDIVAIPDTHDPESPFRYELDAIRLLLDRWRIQSWLMAPLTYQGRLVGMIELHHCQANPYEWTEDDKELVDAIAAQLSVAIIQAEAYANLQDLNRQLEALDLTRANLIAITGHELRTPLSTIQVCLESLSTEPDMPAELRQVMIQAALEDAERMRKLVQDFLTLSKLESGRVEWNMEALSIQECVDLALSSVNAHNTGAPVSNIKVKIPKSAPLVRADGEWLVEVLVKLLDNASKFTPAGGRITIQVTRSSPTHLQVTIADTGRGIEPSRLDAVFDRFYQEEGALRRTTGGTGLGLAMCRQIVEGLGGTIWADSEGKNKGSQFHFTVPIAQGKGDSRSRNSLGNRHPQRTGQPATLPGNPSVLLDD
ncbi:DICT sensory domain-containing protein [Phormidium sp. FACHB-1136]|uniref:DICT sensory domain-containing protein n=1 Tax=Phormidium sp. FACHB-1136 TaxID=2692848 RepID=UPI0016865BF1|nr:DICT sensory domain-containing protein [Phormidium sp. FACHB-1136]MBD2427241.1 GAF domain-containing protein [Phormidium sp. FACHB-1136]